MAYDDPAFGPHQLVVSLFASGAKGNVGVDYIVEYRCWIPVLGRNIVEYRCWAECHDNSHDLVRKALSGPVVADTFLFHGCSFDEFEALVAIIVADVSRRARARLLELHT